MILRPVIPREWRGSGGQAPATAVHAPSWHSVRDLSTNEYGYQHYFAAFQGSGGQPAFSDDSSTLFVTTQEGQTGIIKLVISGLSGTVVGGFPAVLPQYNNIRQLAQSGGHLFATCSTGANVSVVLNTSFSILINNLDQDGGNRSHAAACDGTWGFATVDLTPAGGNPSGGGAVTCTLLSNGTQFTFKSGVDWSNSGNGSAYWIYLDTTNKRAYVGATGGIYALDYTTLYGGTPSAPTLISGWPLTTQRFGTPNASLKRLYTVDGSNNVNTFDTTTITTVTTPIGGSSTYAGGHAYNEILFDSVNNLLYLPWGTAGGGAGGTDILSINTGTDALALKTTIAGVSVNGITQGNVFAALSPDGNRYATSDEYSGSQGVTCYDVSAIHTGGSASQLFRVPCSAETRSAIMVEGDSAAFVYMPSRYELQIANASDQISAVKDTGALTGSQWRHLGVTSGTDPHGTNGPCTTPDAFLLLGQPDGFNDKVLTCSAGSITVQDLGVSTFVDAFWDGKYLWTCRDNVGHNGTLDVTPYAVTYSGGAWAFNTITNANYTAGYVNWTGSFTGFPQCSCALVPGTSYDANTAAVLAANGWDANDFPNNQSGSGVHLISFPNNAQATETTNGIFPDPVLAPVSLSGVSYTVQSGGSLDVPYTYWFQLAYYDTNGVLLGLSPYPAFGAAGTSVVLASQEIVIGNLPTPPTSSASIVVGGGYAFGSATWTNQGFAIIKTVVSSVPSIVIDTAKEGWSGGMPLPGNPMATAGDLQQMAVDSTYNIIYVPCGDSSGIRGYNMATNTLSVVLSQSGLPGPYSSRVLSSCVYVGAQGGKRWLVSNNYGANPGNTGTGLLVWDISNGAASGLPQVLATANEGFTCGGDDTLGLIWLGCLAGMQGFAYS